MATFSPQGLGTLGHPGIFIGQSKPMGLVNHLDIPYVTSMAPKKDLDFGLLDLWALKQRTDSPILTMAVDNAQVILSDADFYTFKLKSAADATTRLISGGTGADRQGRDGEPIPFIVSRRDLGPGSVFKFDVTSRISFTVIDRTIEEVGKHYKLWAVLNTNAHVPYVTQAEFQPQRQIIKLMDIAGLDFGSNKASWEISNVPSLMKFRNYLSTARLQQSYRVSSGAVEFLNEDHRFDGAQLEFLENTVMQFYSIRGIADNKIVDATKNKAEYEGWAKQLDAEKSKGNGEAAMVNLLDSICVDILLSQNNNQMIWSDGINTLRDGYDTMRVVPGVWFQLDLAGYKRSFSIPGFTLDTITDAIKDFEYGKVALRPSISTNVYVIKTGRAGQELIYKEFIKKGFQIPGMLINTDHGFVKGDANNLVYRAARFIEYQIPNIGILRVEWEPGFDPVKADEYVNPQLASGYRLTSYTMLIEDYDTSRDNMVIVRRKNSRIKMNVEAGEDTHPLFRMNYNIAGQNISVTPASDELSGYQVKFKGKADTAIVKDPTKLLKLVPKNPRTGIAAL